VASGVGADVGGAGVPGALVGWLVGEAGLGDGVETGFGVGGMVGALDEHATSTVMKAAVSPVAVRLARACLLCIGAETMVARDRFRTLSRLGADRPHE
jgi:hypothetical protein